MKRSETRILSTHVGSMPRPEELLRLGNWQSGPPKDLAEYRRVMREAVAEVVRKQAAVGLDVINDGEFGKTNWANYVLKRVTGFEQTKERLVGSDWLGSDRVRFAEFLEESMGEMIHGMPGEICTGPIRYQDIDSLQASIGALTEALKSVQVEEAFMTAVAPASADFTAVNRYYATEREYVFALAEALREEYRAIHDAGLLVQVDDAVLANMYDALVSQSPERYREWAQLRIDALNHALEGIPEDRVRYHLCFGSWHLPHISDAPLEEVVGFILQVKAGAYSIEAANPRHEHEWRVWETVKLPEGKILIPGVITHHIITVEHPRLIADRIIRYAKLVGRENVIAGADCGFAQADIIRRVHPEIMWAKFEALVEGAKLASEELWGRKAAA
jgi:5-methyltetrahydropteroyltriglutamate--homocysteine methyltransferase